jgi:hypothetical protein
MKAATTVKQDIPLPSRGEVSINHLIIQTYGRLEMKERNDFTATAGAAGHVRNDLAAVFVAPSRTSPTGKGITKTKQLSAKAQTQKKQTRIWKM